MFSSKLATITDVKESFCRSGDSYLHWPVAPSDGDVGPNSQDFRKECAQVRVGVDEEAEPLRRFNMQMSSVSFRWRIKVWLFSTSFPLPLSSHPSLVSRGLWMWQGLCVGNSGEWKGQGDPVEGTNFWGSVRSVWNKSVALLVLRTCSQQGVLNWAHNSRPVYSTLKYLRMGLGEKRESDARGPRGTFSSRVLPGHTQCPAFSAFRRRKCLCITQN